MTTVAAAANGTTRLSSSASASRNSNNKKKANRTAIATHTSLGSDATREIYGYAILGLAFLLVSLLYLGHGALLYSDPTDDITKKQTTPSTTANMSSTNEGFRYRRVDPGQSDAEVLRFVMERRDATQAESTSPGTSISMKEGMTILSQDTSESRQMANDISTLISYSAFDGVFFEMPGVNSSTISSMPFEFVLVNAPLLARFAESNSDQYAFEEHLGECAETQTCCAFDNLGGDARLIAPRRMRDDRPRQPEVYSHLAAFVRGADEGQIVDMWKLSASEYLRTVQERRTTGRRTWFSTSGLGVAWLHVRLDSYPKYYQYGPFKR